MNFPEELKYTKSHEWAKRDGNKVVVGITEYAQKEISDVVYVELPKVGQEVAKEKAAAVVESVKAAFDIYAPVSGKVVAVNENLESDPGTVNGSPYGEGWFFEVELSNEGELDELMDSAAYQESVKA